MRAALLLVGLLPALVAAAEAEPTSATTTTTAQAPKPASYVSCRDRSPAAERARVGIVKRHPASPVATWLGD